MRSLLLPLICMLGLGQAVRAQEFRFSGGYNGSQVSEAGDERWAGKAGYQFGADVLLGDRWFLKTGVHFLVRNVNYSLLSTAGDGVTTTANGYQYTSRHLRVPLTLGLHLIDPSTDPVINIYAFGGPSALFRLSADLDNDQLDVQTQPAQWYLGFGAGAELDFLFLEAGYDVAMSNVFEGNDFHTNPKVNYVYASAGIRLRLAH